MQITITCRVPLNEPLLFNRWLPVGRASSMPLRFKEHEVRLWFDLKCVESRGTAVTEELIAKEVSAVKTICAEVLSDVDDNLAKFIFLNHDWPSRERILESVNPNVREHAIQYETLGREVLEAIITTVNSLLSWIHAEKNHYWLRLDTVSKNRMWSANVGFRSQVSGPGLNPVRWVPPCVEITTLCNPYEGDYITSIDWKLIGDRLAQKKRPSAIKEFLSNANAMLDEGHLRSAILESVIALELALNQFAKAPDVTMFRDDRVFVKETLDSRVKHLGFSTSIAHLLPLVFPESFVNSTLLSEVCDAIACRQNIAHSGQRSLSEAQARGHVISTRRLAFKLISATLQDGV